MDFFRIPPGHWIIAEGRRDLVTKNRLVAGDVVVQCRHCKNLFRLDSWEYENSISDNHGGVDNTVSELVRVGRRQDGPADECRRVTGLGRSRAGIHSPRKRFDVRHRTDRKQFRVERRDQAEKAVTRLRSAPAPRPVSAQRTFRPLEAPRGGLGDLPPSFWILLCTLLLFACAGFLIYMLH